MRKILATILVVGLVFVSFGGLPALGEETEPEQSIGRYERIMGSGDLTENHVMQTASGLAFEGPAFTNTLRVDKGFLEAELGAWSASAAFSLDGDHVVFEGRKADFAPLEIGADPVFTLGSRDHVEFQERPMWVSVEQPGYGDQITLEMDDGDTQGQQVFIAKEWLWDRGIHRPVAVHEDGTNLSVEPTEGRDGWMIDVHHFSYIAITATDMVVFSRQDGIIVPHTDETRWYTEEKRLEIDVGFNCAMHIILAPGLSCNSIDQDVMVDKDWMDMRVDYLALQEHVWEVNKYDLTVSGEEDYYEVALTAGQLPTTVVYENFTFESTAEWLFTAGSPYNMYLFDQPQPVKVKIIAPGNIEIEFGDSPMTNYTGNIAFRSDLLLELGIDRPHMNSSWGERLPVSASGGFVQTPGGNGDLIVESSSSLSGIDVADERCNTSANFFFGNDPVASWDGDEGHGSASADLYVVSPGVFCFEWSLTEANDFTTAMWLSHMAVRDSGTGAGCHFGNAAEGGGEVDIFFGSGVSLSGQEGAAECSWEHETHGLNVDWTFTAHAISHTPHEEKYSGKKKPTGCFTGEAGQEFGWWGVVAKLAKFGGAPAGYCAAKWAEKGESKLWDDDDDLRSNEAIITGTPGEDNGGSGGSVEIEFDLIDTNDFREDSWAALHMLGIRPEHWAGWQTVTWEVNYGYDSEIQYKSDLSLLRQLNIDDDSNLEADWDRGMPDFSAEQTGGSNLEAEFDVQVDWKAPTGLILADPTEIVITLSDPFGGEDLWIDLEMIVVGFDGSDPVNETVFHVEANGTNIENEEMNWGSQLFMASDVHDLYANHGPEGHDEWALIRAIVQTLTTNTTMGEGSDYTISAQDPGAGGESGPGYEYDSPFEIWSGTKSVFSPIGEVLESDVYDILIEFKYLFTPVTSE